mgnify:FL=1
MAFLQVNFFSSVLGMCTAMNVILPQTTSTRGLIGVDTADVDVTYPVLYLLHGMSDDHTIWSRRTSIERYADERGIAVVMPTTELGWYTNMKHGRRWRTYIGEELPAICHDFFPRISQKREDTYIAGLSMGGYGAYALAMTYPEQYSAAAGLSGAYMPLRFGRDTEPFWQDIFGTMSDFTGSENDLVATSSRLVREGAPLPRLYMWCGTEDGLYSQNLAMRDHLNAIGWEDFTFEESAGNHNWKCWDEKIQTVLAWIHAGR